MPFVDKQSLWAMRMPGKVYVHETGIARAFGNNHSAIKYATDIVEGNSNTHFDSHDYDFFVAALWGDGKDRVAEFFRYKGTGIWPGNPEMKAFVYRNGIWQPNPEAHACEDTIIMLGREAEYRRASNDEKRYLSTFPDLGELFVVHEG